MKKKILQKAKHQEKPFPIVAIGASAGGLEAVSEIIKNLPQKLGMAIVYIQHLDPNHKSMLPEILAKLTKMKVQNAKHLIKIKPDNIYIIPHNKNISLIDGVLTLKKRQPKPGINLPIDTFFKALAENYKEAAIGIVLSGNGHDGTLGLKAIKNYGGLTFAQDESARFGSMPTSAISEGCVDMVLAPKDIALELERLSNHTSVLQQVLEEQADVKEEELEKILELVLKTAGVNFQHYKPSTIKRRIVRRMLLVKHNTLDQYYNYLKKHKDEAHLLFRDLLINVTAFFRDEQVLAHLKSKVIPKILKEKTGDESIRVWVPACSTGEEAYTLGMIFLEMMGERGVTVPLQIFATDVSDKAIDKARSGIYSKNDLENVSPKQLQRFFAKVDGSHRINKVVRDVCIFAPHNVLSDPPFLKLDLVSCCNLMIYLKPVLQKKVLSVFHYSLRPSGYLVLGKSETLGESTTSFSQPEKKFKVFVRKNEVFSRLKMDIDRHNVLRKPAIGLHSETLNRSQTKSSNLEKKVEAILLTKFVSASVVVNKELDILQFHGPISSFIQISPGKASLNLLRLVKPSLVMDLRSAVHKAERSGKNVKKSGIELMSNEELKTISIEIIPLDAENGERLSLIVFEKMDNDPASDHGKKILSRDQLVKKLQTELEVTKEDMRSILEEQEASNEELQSANEEIVSSNEELQSINEELETSKEEIESSLEELTTINNELQVRNEQLAESHEYSQAVSETIREAVLILDKDFRVRSANKAFYRLFRTHEEATEGMLLYELGNKQWDIFELRQMLDEIVVKRTPISGFEVRHEFPSIGYRVMLLHAQSIIQKAQQKQVIILAIEDITHHKLAEQAALEREAWFRNMADNTPSLVWLCGPNKIRTFFNKAWFEFTGLKPTDKTFSLEHLIHAEDVKVYKQQFDHAFVSRTPFSIEFRLLRFDGEYRWMLDVAKPYYSNKNEFLGYIGSTTELHDKKIMLMDLDQQVRGQTQELKSINAMLQQSNTELQQFAFIASHDLQEPLRKILTYINRIQILKVTLPPDTITYFEKIADSAARMSKLIDDLLDFSTTTFITRKFANVDLNKIINGVLNDLELVIAEKKAEINVDPHIPEIQGDDLQLWQLVQNLISNSLKFVDNGVAPRINITYQILQRDELDVSHLPDNPGPFIELVFSDNGIGFNPGFAEKIFIIFQRLNERKKFPGTGIGLAICKRIVTNHHGLIFAESTGRGASFHVVLPIGRNPKIL